MTSLYCSVAQQAKDRFMHEMNDLNLLLLPYAVYVYHTFLPLLLSKNDQEKSIKKKK